MSDRVRELVAKWRERADTSEPYPTDAVRGQAISWRNCADELEAALAASEPTSAETLPSCAGGAPFFTSASDAPSGQPVTSASDLQAKLEALRDHYEFLGYYEISDKLTAILEGR